MQPLLNLESISLVRGLRHVLTNVSFSIAESERVVLMGPSGVGKTSLLYVIAGLLREGEGTIRSGGRILQGPRTFVPPGERGFGFVFHGGGLFPHLTVDENLRLQAPAVSETWQNRLESELMVAPLRRLRPAQLSAGQAQRVGLLRTLLLSPRLILMDEVFSTLDGSMRRAVRGLVVEFLAEHRIGALIVTHDEREASEVASRVILLEDGHLIQDADFDGAYRKPASFDSGWLLGPLSLWRHQSADVDELLRPEELMIRAEDQGEGVLGTVRTCEAQADHYIIQVLPDDSSGVSRDCLYGISRVRLAPGARVAVQKTTQAKGESRQERNPSL